MNSADVRGKIVDGERPGTKKIQPYSSKLKTMEKKMPKKGVVN